MAFRKISVAPSAFLSRWIWVIRMFAFTAKTKPGGVCFTQDSNVAADGKRRKV